MDEIFPQLNAFYCDKNTLSDKVKQVDCKKAFNLNFI